MQALIWGTLLLPLAGFLILIFLGRRMGERAVTVLGVGSVGLAAVLAVVAAALYLRQGAQAWTHVAATWLRAGSLEVELSVSYDGLALVMTLVVTVVGFLIHLFSAEYMHADEAYHRYFAYLNLFVASMLLLVLAGNLLVTFVGWELVGLCSFLLIGFWYREPANSRAARKAFIVTRIGDAGFAVGVGLLFAALGTLNIREAGGLAGMSLSPGSPMAIAIAVCFLVAAIGKSAQLPLQVWLPDAMAGPTPVSALIHAATMVTAGVYLVARMHLIFEIAPAVLQATAWIGALTLLVAGLAATAQTDLKRTLAYSTISQIGYMFLALGVSAFGASVFHLFTHAFFKALLFLGAGAVMHATHGEQDMYKMGGLARKLPLVFVTFLAGAASLASIPLVTDGFYSKGWILEEIWVRGAGSRALWGIAVAGAAITAFYTFRMVGLVFLGSPRTEVGHRPGARMAVPLVVLALGAVIAGLLHTPVYLGGARLFDTLLSNVFAEGSRTGEEILPELYASLAVMAGAILGLVAYRNGPASVRSLAAAEARPNILARSLKSGLGFDATYDRLVVRPYDALGGLQGRRDLVDFVVRAVELLNLGLHRALAALQSGKLRFYLLGVCAALVVVLGVEVLL